MKDDKYVKVVYQSKPIGERKIILYLTKFDAEAFEKDQELERMPTKVVKEEIPIEKGVRITVPYYEKLLNKKVDMFYKKEIEEMKRYIERNRWGKRGLR